MADDLMDKPRINKPLIGVVVAVIAALIGWYYFASRHAPMAIVAPAAPPAVPGSPPDAVEHPVPAQVLDATPLPDLADSDKAMNDALGDAFGAAVAQYLVPEGVIRHLVVTVDNLPRQKVSVDKRPVVPTAGVFLAKGDELHATLDPQNFQRYQPMVDLIGKADMKRVAAVYLRFYPLFQKAYQDLGYPNGYFNDRLVKVIDELLATPQVTAPIELVRPNVMYLFADQTLESRPAGQKLLIRMGPDNAAVLKGKLTELRGIITTAAPKH